MSNKSADEDGELLQANDQKQAMTTDQSTASIKHLPEQTSMSCNKRTPKKLQPAY